MRTNDNQCRTHKKLTLACAALLLFVVPSAHAVTHTVTNTRDMLAGSLRQAIQDADFNEMIVFNIPTSDPGYYAPTGVFTINLSSGLTISKNLIISGAGSRVVVRRNVGSSFSIFTVSANTEVRINNLTISNGYADSGGGIYNLGYLILTGCTLSGNQSTNSQGPGGGGLYNGGSADVYSCTFAGNKAVLGGAIRNGRSLLLFDSTLSGNDGSSAAGGVMSYSDVGSPASARVGNTIIAGNTGGNNLPDVFGGFNSDGYNFIGVATGADRNGFGNSGSRDQVGTLASPAPAKLGLLRDNGGSTSTMAPLPGSLVIDQGKRIFAFNFDQRGLPRPVDQPSVIDASEGDGNDVGAVELSTLQPGPNFTVNKTDDHDDAACGVADCTLREALNAANVDANANTVGFAPGLSGPIINSLTPTGIVITQPVTINGPGARLLTISGGNANRCLQVKGGTVVINGLTFANASNGANGVGGTGGAIQNRDGATLTLNDCTFSANSITDNGFGAGYGAGVAQLNGGQLNINRCTFADNTAAAGGGGLGILNGTVVVTNSTFTRNSGPNGGAIAIFEFNSSLSSSLDLRSSTVVGNQAITPSGKGGGVSQVFSGSTIIVSNSIIAGNTSAGTDANVSGAFSSQGWNLIGPPGAATGFGASGDQVGVADPKVGSLGNYGGPTDTMTLLAGSTAIDRGNSNGLATDQRRYSRTGISDIGAFELGGIELRILNLARNANDLYVTFGATIPGKIYRLERNSQPTAFGWSQIPEVPDYTATATGSAVIVHPNALSQVPPVFYRVILLP